MSAKLARRTKAPQIPGLMRLRSIPWIFAGAVAMGADPPPPQQSDSDQLYQVGQQLFDQFAPPEVKEEYAFPTKEQWDQLALRLDQALQGESLEAVAAMEPEARAALGASRTLPGYADYADWLELRLDEISAARQAAGQARIPAPRGRQDPVPYYGLWLARERARPVPEAAAELMPLLRSAFASEGVPPELAWLAEVESSLKVGARNPSGARGLFQLMPETAHALGLSTFLPDQRTDPEKSAHAAAHLLNSLFSRFGSWPLALAAYNAGEGRLSRLLASKGAHDFAGVAQALPVETRMYVPKVCALVEVRTGKRLAEGGRTAQ